MASPVNSSFHFPLTSIYGFLFRLQSFVNSPFRYIAPSGHSTGTFCRKAHRSQASQHFCAFTPQSLFLIYWSMEHAIISARTQTLWKREKAKIFLLVGNIMNKHVKRSCIIRYYLIICTIGTHYMCITLEHSSVSS